MFLSFFNRLGADFWPLDRSFVGPNLVADVVHWIIIGTVLYLVWPRFHRTVDAWVRRHLHNHHLLHVAPHHDAVTDTLVELHQKLDHLISLAQPKEKAIMSLASEVVADIEHRFSFHAASDPNVANAHESVRQLLIDAAKAIIEITPEGREAALVLTKLEEADHWAHAAIARNMDKVAPVPANPSSVAAEPTPEPAVSPNVPPAAAPSPEAPVAEPGVEADTTVVQPDVVKVDEPAEAAPVDPEPVTPVPEAAPAAPAAPAEPTDTWPTTPPAAPVDSTLPPPPAAS